MHRALIACLVILGTCSLVTAMDDSSGETPNSDPTTQTDPPMLGGLFQLPPSSVQAEQGLESDEGVLVRRVYDETAADRMGLQSGDVLLTINGQSVNGIVDVRDEVGLYEVGDAVAVTVRRDGQTITLADRFGKWPTDIDKEHVTRDMEDKYRERMQKHIDGMENRIADLDERTAALDEALSELEEDAAGAGGGSGQALQGGNPLAQDAEAPAPAIAVDAPLGADQPPGPESEGLPWRLRYTSRPPELAAVVPVDQEATPMSGEPWQLSIAID